MLFFFSNPFFLSDVFTTQKMLIKCMNLLVVEMIFNAFVATFIEGIDDFDLKKCKLNEIG